MFTRNNIRKNFLRVKQTADQKLGRVEKTEVLSDDLQTSEKRVEVVKQVMSNSAKKLSGSLLVTGTSDADKRLKRMPEAGLAHGMIESATVLGSDDKETKEFNILGQMFQRCGDCQNALARNHLEYEIEVEQNVLDPVTAIVEVEIPQISKLKKALTKVTLDMDSAKTRWQHAVRQTHVPGVNIAAASVKADAVKEELEEAEARVDQARDAYTTGLFNFISREADHSANLVHLLETQVRYHEKALDIINQMLPKMKETLHCSPVKPVYGTSLEEHLRVTNRDIAHVLESCVCYLLEHGLMEEGLFRIAGMASKVKKLKASFDAGIDLEDIGDLDPHTVAGALKQYLRELPEPLLTYAKFNEFVAAVQQPADQRLQQLWMVVDTLPKPNYDNFRYLIKFLAKLTEKSEVNKMSPGNIAIVIGPNLIWSEGDSGPNMMNTGILSLITELIVQHADWFFPGEIATAPTSSYDNSSPRLQRAPESEEHPALERSSSNQSASSTGTPQSSPLANQTQDYSPPVNQGAGYKSQFNLTPTNSLAASSGPANLAAPPQTPPLESRSPSVSPAASSTNLTPTTDSEDLHPVQRRQPRKPAPPPPERPERPYSVAVSASVKPPAQYQTWPRQQPLSSDDEVGGSLVPGDKHQTLPNQERSERPNPPERVSSLPPGHHPHADRPKVPPPVVPPTHKRSASTGAPVIVPGEQLQAMNFDSSTELNKTGTL